MGPDRDRVAEKIRSAYRESAGRWTGCNWSTRFGSAELNLEKLNSTQATILARATAGTESAMWRDAARWLQQIEEAAREALQEAEQAVELAETGQFAAALVHARRAVSLEETYRTPQIWQRFVDVIEDAMLAGKSSLPTGA